MKFRFMCFIMMTSFALIAQHPLDTSQTNVGKNGGTDNPERADKHESQAQNDISTGRSKFSVNINQNSSHSGRMILSAVSGPSIQYDSIDLGAINYNIGSDFSIHNSSTKGNKIVINSDGLYHIEGLIKFNLTHNANGLAANTSLNLLYESPGMTNMSYPLSDKELLSQNDFVIPFNYGKGVHFQLSIYFKKGGNFTLQTIFENLTHYPYNNISAGNGYISGYKISD